MDSVGYIRLETEWSSESNQFGQLSRTASKKSTWSNLSPWIQESTRTFNNTIAMSMMRSGMRSAGALLCRPVNGAAGRPVSSNTRRFASSAHDDEHETAKWEKITFLGIATCTILSIYHLSHDHEHSPEPPAYPYLHIRNKEFPWGPDGLFEMKKHDH